MNISATEPSNEPDDMPEAFPLADLEASASEAAQRIAAECRRNCRLSAEEESTLRDDIESAILAEASEPHEVINDIFREASAMLTSLVDRPEMWGGMEAVEANIITLLRLVAVAAGEDSQFIRTEFSAFLALEKFNPQTALFSQVTDMKQLVTVMARFAERIDELLEEDDLSDTDTTAEG